MRVLFLFLFIINILLGVWFYVQPSKIDSSENARSSGLKPLILLSEKEFNGPEENSIVEPATVKLSQTSEASPKMEHMCYTLGPFKEELLLEQARNQLPIEAFDLHVRKRQESQHHRYWVYLSAFSSRAKALQKSKVLVKAGINDYYILHNGKNKNTISLGHFKEKKHASARVKKVRNRGFDAKLDAIFRQVNVYWLDYSTKEADDLSEGSIKDYLIDGVTRINRDCDI